MIFGLSDSEREFIFENLIAPLKQKGARVFVFGSRAKGTQKKFSDIDLVFQTPIDSKVPGHFLHKLLMNIEDSNFPYKIDLVDESDLAQSYKKNILLEMKEL